MARGEYASASKGGGAGWKPLLVLGAVAAGLYLVSPGGREWLARGKLPPSPEDELESIARERGYANAAEYERLVGAIAQELKDSGWTVETPNAPHIAEQLR